MDIYRIVLLIGKCTGWYSVAEFASGLNPQDLIPNTANLGEGERKEDPAYSYKLICRNK